MLTWLKSFTKIARGITFLQIEPYDLRYPKMGKESLFAFPYGLKCSLIFGQMVRPVFNPFKTKFTRKSSFPFVDIELPNPWTATEESGDRWFVFRSIIPIPMFFISFVSPWNKGGYFGTKIYKVDEDVTNIRCVWAKDSDRGNYYTCPSFSTRSTAVDGDYFTYPNEI